MLVLHVERVDHACWRPHPTPLSLHPPLLFCPFQPALGRLLLVLGLTLHLSWPWPWLLRAQTAASPTSLSQSLEGLASHGPSWLHVLLEFGEKSHTPASSGIPSSTLPRPLDHRGLIPAEWEIIGPALESGIDVSLPKIFFRPYRYGPSNNVWKYDMK